MPTRTGARRHTVLPLYERVELLWRLEVPRHAPVDATAWQSLAALAWAYERRGDAALQRHACRQLVLRASEVGLAPNAPELLAARQTLQVAA
jgi:hypothetical protein